MASPAPDAASSSTLSATSSTAPPPLPPGWTANTAPSGHTFYYNAQTKESTYKRPGPLVPPPPPPLPPALPPAAHGPVPVAHHPAFPAQQPFITAPSSQGPQVPTPFLRLSDPRVANAFMAQQNAAAARSQPNQQGGRFQTNIFQQRPRPQPRDRPRSRVPIPGCEPWVLVYTKYGRRFVFNPVKKASFWRIPEKLLPAVLDMDKASLRQKALGAMADEKNDNGRGDEGGSLGNKAKPARSEGASDRGEQGPEEFAASTLQKVDDDSEYEEFEVTDVGEYSASDGGEGEYDEDGGRRKRQRTDTGMYSSGHGPLEFSEADIAFQLQAAGETGAAYAFEGREGEWGDGPDEGREKAAYEKPSEEEAAALFKSLLDDFQVNPFSSWEKLMEEGKIFDDDRYTALPSTKARKAVWEAWSRDAIRERKEKAAAEAKKADPRAVYLQLLQEHATPKLYWAEFKRKYRKEAAMKAVQPPDKEKEKLYRDYVARRKLPAASLKADLTKLLDGLPLSVLNNQTDMASLPPELAHDMRYVAAEAKVRDALVEAYIKTAGPPPV